MKKILSSLILLLTIHIQVYAIGHGGGSLLLVGQGGGACSYTSIQLAINDANPNSEIRVTNEVTHFENLSVTKHLTIKGGYENCGQALLDSRLDGSRTTINAGAVGNAVVVTGVATEFDMSGFTLTNGVNAFLSEGGAVSILSADSTILFEQMNISINAGLNGGGINMGVANINLTLSNTLVDNNTALNGGGIYCGDGGFIQLKDNSGILGNQANGLLLEGLGGGIYSNKCFLWLLSGEGGMGAFSLVGISNNSASNSGGGIYINDGFISSNQFSGVVNIDHNIANSDMNDSGDGGGIYMINGRMSLSNTLFYKGNTVFAGNGGALFMDNSQYFSDSTVGSFDICLENGNEDCGLFINNRAIGAGLTLGGAIYMQNNSGPENAEGSLRARFINNRADGGAAITLVTGSTMNLQNSYFIGNGNDGAGDTSDFNVIRVLDAGSEIVISFSTLANNRNNYIFALFDGGQARVYKSVIYEQGFVYEVLSPANSPDFLFDCSLLHEGFTPGAGLNNSLITLNPGFVNQADGNYQLRFDSPAIDRCTTADLSADVEIRMDFDADERGFDIPGVNNAGMFASHYDAGADEYNDIIFANGFE